ncbi:hypothetical protein [Burkholderia sp. JP2-270]|uniref:hypothetical protein n=1 Tax=Burkholderia sp. JP2-270 TaxID=2217913 RepID=UPI0013A6AF48|nr:hypothetical protein [Burkholderia sp. JP2-270]
MRDISRGARSSATPNSDTIDPSVDNRIVRDVTRFASMEFRLHVRPRADRQRSEHDGDLREHAQQILDRR